MKRRIRALILVLLAAGLVYWAWWLHQGGLTIERIAAQEDRLRWWIEAAPVRAFVIGFALYTLASLVPGTPGKSVVFGWLYGFWQGTAIINGALTAAALGGFFVSRYLLFDLVHRKFRNIALRIDEALQRDGPFYLLTLRLAPFPYSLLNYSSGATRVPVRTFWWTTQVGLVPKAAVYAFLGAQLPTLQVLVEEGVEGVLNPWLLVAMALPALVPIAIRFGLRRFSPHTETPIKGTLGE